MLSRLSRRAFLSPPFSARRLPSSLPVRLLSLSALASSVGSAVSSFMGQSQATQEADYDAAQDMSFYDLKDTLTDGTPVAMDRYKNQVCYVLNVASQWGATKREYALVKKLGEELASKGLRILLFPTREYGGQEFKEDSKVLAFAEAKGFKNGEHGDLFSVGNIKGASARPVWSYLYAATKTKPPMWNFKGKYLIDRDGNARVPKDVEGEIRELVAASASASAAAPAAAAAPADGGADKEASSL